MLTDQDVTKLVNAQKRVFATKQDVLGLSNRILGLENRVATKEDAVDLRTSFSDLQASVDRYLTFTEAWHQELTILKSRQDRLSQVLVNKGIVSEKEIALLG